jgi:glycogen operon protein
MVGDALGEVDEQGRPLRGDTLLILLNAHHQDVPFALPTISPNTAWVRILDTIAPYVEERRYTGDTEYPLQGRTLALFTLSSERKAEQLAPR